MKRAGEPHCCLPTTTGFFRKRKEVCLCSTTFVYIRQLLAETKITIFDIFSKIATKSRLRDPLLKYQTVSSSTVSHFGLDGRQRLRISWIYFLLDGCAAPFSPSLLCEAAILNFNVKCLKKMCFLWYFRLGCRAKFGLVWWRGVSFRDYFTKSPSE